VRTSCRPLLAALVLAVLAAGCGAAATGPGAAATVDGVDIPRDRVERGVRELLGDVDELDPEQRGEQVAAAQRAVLNNLIQSAAIEAELQRRGIAATEAEAQAFRAELVETYGSEDAIFAAARQQAISPSMFEEIFIYQEAGIQLLVRELAGDEQLEVRTIRHILVETEEQAQDVVDELAAGADFATLAAQRSQDAGSAQAGGVLPPTTPGTYVEGFEEAAWSAAEGETVGPVESQFGWHVLEVIEAFEGPERDAPFDILSQRYTPELREVLGPAVQDAEVALAPGLGRWVPGSGVQPESRAGLARTEQPIDG
jgi:parvulin-like peptidyl-prolyl isomerase